MRKPQSEVLSIMSGGVVPVAVLLLTALQRTSPDRIHRVSFTLSDIALLAATWLIYIEKVPVKLMISEDPVVSELCPPVVDEDAVVRVATLEVPFDISVT